MSLLDSDIKQIAAGDRETFDKLHDILYDRLFYYAYKMTRDVGESEDLVQDTFIHFWENSRNFQEVIAVKVYLYSTLTYKINNHLRKKSRYGKLLDKMPAEENISNEHLIISAEISSQVRQAVMKLPPQTRRVLELSLLDMSQEEIAADMNISVNTVKTLKKAGYRTLRESLAHLKALLPILFIP